MHFWGYFWVAAALLAACASAGTFVVEGDNFVKDGKPFRIVSGAFHYFRTPRQLWADRLTKMRQGGLNTVETYVAWNLHEPVRGQVTFEGDLDIVEFIKTAHAIGLLVIVRPPPFICAEWEFGGMPAWLLAIPGIELRNSNAKFLEATDAFLNVLAPMLAPYQYSRGGPIIAVQIENEYGSYGSDKVYLDHLLDTLLATELNDVIFFSSNGDTDSMQSDGATGRVLRTINFGVGENVDSAFKTLRKYQKTGPIFNTEYWAGWFDALGGGHNTRSAKESGKTLDEILSRGASVNIYMYVGGTNFGFMNGANTGNGDTIQPETTSYDYDAAINEDGDVKDKWAYFRDIIGKYIEVPSDPEPKPSPKTAYGAVAMKAVSTLLDDDVLNAFSQPVHSEDLKTFSELNLDYGYVMYQTTAPAGNSLYLNTLHDRASVYLDNVLQGTANRMYDSYSVRVTSSPNATLRILVENQGHVNYGKKLFDEKGILGGASLEGTQLNNWTIWTLPLARPLPKEALAGTKPIPTDGAAWSVDCDSSDLHQQWKFSGTTGSLESNGMCLSGACSDIGNGCAPLRLVPCVSGNKDQTWTLNNKKQLVNSGNNGCIDLWGGKGPQVGIYKCGGDSNQKWTFANGLVRSAANSQCISGGKELAPVFYKGTLNIANEPTDTYLSVSGWSKGVAYINGRALGRYWAASGVQKTLYVPAPWLRKGANEVVMFEEEHLATSKPSALFVDAPNLG